MTRDFLLTPQKKLKYLPSIKHMLEILKIKNFALIDSAEIHFKPGLNIISGETGTGKSLLLEAISLLLGTRVSLDRIRSGCEEAVIEGLFEITELSWMPSRLQSLGFMPAFSELLIKRTIHHTGRHRIFVNGELATLSVLQTLCEGLIDLCSQQEHQSLMKAHAQLELLDQYAGCLEPAKKLILDLSVYRSRCKDYQECLQANQDNIQKTNFLKFQMDEIQQAKLQWDEEEQLQNKKQVLQSAAVRLQVVEHIRQLFESEDTGILRLIQSLFTQVRTLLGLDASIQDLFERIEKINIQVEDGSVAFHHYCRSIEFDPFQLQTVQDRLSFLSNLKRKYGLSLHGLIEMLAQLEREQSVWDQNVETLKQFEKELQTRALQLNTQGMELTQIRKHISPLFAALVTNELKDLKMSESEFQIEIHSKENLLEWSSTGKESVQFLVQTNAGEPIRPLSKIASGGELSRLMLAIRRVISSQGGIGVYLFDEIDAGIGGHTAFEVGKKLKSVAALNQVICITHLPQVAAFANHHLVVQKTVQKDASTKRTLTEVLELTDSAKTEEIARMLGGPTLTSKNLANATELLEMASLF